MVVVMSNAEAGAKRVQTDLPGQTFYDATGHVNEEVTTDDDGAAEFRCNAGSVSVWLSR
jgi:alpha-amylase